MSRNTSHPAVLPATVPFPKATETTIDFGGPQAPACEILAGLLAASEAALRGLTCRSETGPHVFVGTIRGSGAGASFTEALARLEREHPVVPAFPFEGSHHVGGAAWSTETILGSACPNAAVKLCWLAFADDLPMHAHRASDRFIVVLEGRGYFHFSEDPIDRFEPRSTRTLAVRERDALLFTRGVVHTFSTANHPMTLLSVHLPFVALDDDAQYTLPSGRWTARDHAAGIRAQVTAGRWARLV
ncbi:MAG: cupin domain-containing protein [Phycisphaerales bacterium]